MQNSNFCATSEKKLKTAVIRRAESEGYNKPRELHVSILSRDAYDIFHKERSWKWNRIALCITCEKIRFNTTTTEHIEIIFILLTWLIKKFIGAAYKH